jgi:predicted amidohydrolase YtcJ
MIIGFGYDNAQLPELRHPTREDLDQVSARIPIILVHQSGHLGVANSDPDAIERRRQGQFLREDQVDSYQRLGVFPSLFPMHTFYWGDWHRAAR